MSDSVSLILDTDIGDDVDDAFALAQAARAPVNRPGCHHDLLGRYRRQSPARA